MGARHYSPTKDLAKFLYAVLSRELSDNKVCAALLSFAAVAHQELDKLQKDDVSARLNDTLDINIALKQVHRHWNTRFCGHAKLALHEKLLAYDNSPEHRHRNVYAKIIPIIQSSGMGKSRLMDEMSKTNLTILFTFRKNSESGYPPGDPEITRFVDKALSWNDGSPEAVMMAHSHALALVLGALRTLSKWLKGQSAEGDTDILPRGDLARRWYDHMVPVSKDVEVSPTGLLSDVISTTRSKEKIQFCHDTVAKAEKILKRVVKRKDWRGFFLPEVSTSASCPLLFLLLFFKNSLLFLAMVTLRILLTFQTGDFEELQGLKYPHKLQQRVDRIFKYLESSSNVQEPPRLFLVFDEASHLFDGNSGGYFFPALRRILRLLRQQPIWTFLLSTNSTMECLVKPTNEEQSQRLVTHHLERYDPFIALQLDLSMVEKMCSGKEQVLRTPLNTFSTPEHMAMFGRPLWAIYEKRSVEAIHQFALAKIFMNGIYDPANQHHVFAAMAYRLSLDPTMSTVDSSAKNLARRAVCAHLRIVVQMDLTTGTFLTTTPSEPIAADSVAMQLCRQIRKDGPTFWQLSLNTLTSQLLKPGNVGKGETGELYFRTLFVLIRDFYLCRLVPKSPKGHMPYSRPFRLLDFLKSMLATDKFQAVSEMYARQATRSSERVKQPGLAMPRKLSEVFQHAVCNFTHFVCTNQPLSMDSESLSNMELIHGLMMQQAALQCSTGQYLFDLIIPIYLGDPNAAFNQEHLSALLVQVKNSKKAHKLDLKSYKSDYRKYFQSGTTGFHRPLLSVLLNSGVDEHYFELADSFNNTVFGFTLGGRNAQSYSLFQSDPGLGTACNHMLQLLPQDPENSLHSQLCRSNQRFNAHSFEHRFRPSSDNMEGLDSFGDGSPPQKKQRVGKRPKADVI